jgi:hypothetical protein
MKKLASIGILILLCFNCLKAQTNVQNESSFSDRNIKPADLIVEGLITNISYFRDTTETVRNYGLDNPSRDNDGAIWFIKYTIEVQKVFKGQKITTITVIDQNRDREIYINNREITLRIGIKLHGGNLNNFPLNSLGIFFLKKDFFLNLNAIKNEIVYSLHGIRGISGYNFLTESSIDIRDKGEFGEYKKFENLEELYKYLEKETKTKKIYITHKHFFVNNTLEKERNYIGTHFGDSSNSESFMKKIRNGTINQLNADSFFVKQKPPLSKKELRMLQRQRDSRQKVFEKNHLENLKRIKEETNYPKSGSLHKVDETSTYRKICLSCILANINTEHIAPMVA